MDVGERARFSNATHLKMSGEWIIKELNDVQRQMLEQAIIEIASF